MRWSPGPRSQNLEDRRFEQMSPEQALLLQHWYATQGDEQAQQDLPPWMAPPPDTQEAAIGGQSDPAVLQFLKMLGGR